MADVASAYEAASENAVARWKDCPGIGNLHSPPFHPTRLAMTTGAYMTPSESILKLHAGLGNLLLEDPLADITPMDCLHFTFLALSPHDYETAADLPAHSPLKEIFRKHCRQKSFAVSSLRLVALPNALLLAGTPDRAALELRDLFARDLLNSAWREHLKARYPEGSIPPLFWHTTLLRYHADFVPARVRDFFHLRREIEYGEICLPIRLVAANYNWRHLFGIDESSVDRDACK